METKLPSIRVDPLARLRASLWMFLCFLNLRDGFTDINRQVVRLFDHVTSGRVKKGRPVRAPDALQDLILNICSTD